MKRLTLALAGALLVVAPPLEAQDDAVVIFGQYFRCGQGTAGQADDVIRDKWFPVLQRHVDAGNLTGFGLLAHIQGGAWRRGLFTVGSGLDQMMDTRDQIIQELLQDDDALNELGTHCPSHDDYIWTGVSNSSPDPDALGTATMSSYHMCERAHEGRADEIFEEVLAPLYQKHMDMGHIASWGWYAHRSGGVFRRLETMSGADHKTLLNMQGAIYGEADPLAMQELFEICETHVDYMWNNITEPSGP
jgi:hypothetical protein